MNILLTGASGGIGKSILMHLLQGDHLITATYFTTNSDLLDFSENIKWIKVDFSNLDLNYEKTFNDQYDVVIHCAGIAISGLIGKQNHLDVQRQIQVNLTTAILIVDFFLPKMITSGFGRIVLISSIVGRDGSIGLSAYSASKSGLSGLLKSSVREIPIMKKRFGLDSNVTLNVISPGYTETQMISGVPVEVKERLLSRSALNRFVNPNEIATLIDFIIDPDSIAICGANFEINGGSSL